MKTLLFLLLSIMAVAQTRSNISQLAPVPGEGIRVLSMTADGTPTWLKLGPGLGVSNGQIVVVASAIPSVKVEQTKLVLENGNYTIPTAPGFVTRNGYVQEAGKDYVIQDGKLLPNALFDRWLPTDVVIFTVININGTPSFI